MKRSIITTAILSLFFTVQLSAQQPIIPLWENGVPFCQSENQKEVKDDERIGRIISKVSNPTIEVFLPPESIANGTGVVVCPGGGYTILAYDWEGTSMAKWLNSIGVAAFVLSYRLPHWESDECRDKVALADAQRAIRMVRNNAEDWKLNPEKIGIMGFSAGGHLASTAGTHYDKGNKKANDPIEKQSSRPDFMILMYPVVTMDPTHAHMGSRENLIGKKPPADALLTFSNEKMITSDTPPTLLIHADDDKGVVPENSVEFYLNLRKHGVPAALHIFEKGGHGFSFGEGKGIVEKWPELAEGWMRGRGLLDK